MIGSALNWLAACDVYVIFAFPALLACWVCAWR